MFVLLDIKDGVVDLPMAKYVQERLLSSLAALSEKIFFLRRQ